ncbi:hypothetical protein JR316_0011795 [Psilocybe cubensis]|uniref:Uncharacterized protein n=2 Tax=Psilocybe cubensis TaxID=181762 RepID=A0A8H7XLG8_PSICU|nr:hypothetical protein JR316_0011795 [Psilocybe cubensis]KAH9476224.1 hypothetical protein JR316_0011795 [Psilocybe cubensis]
MAAALRICDDITILCASAGQFKPSIFLIFLQTNTPPAALLRFRTMKVSVQYVIIVTLMAVTSQGATIPRALSSLDEPNESSVSNAGSASIGGSYASSSFLFFSSASVSSAASHFPTGSPSSFSAFPSGSAASISAFPSGSAASFSAFPSGSAASFSAFPSGSAASVSALPSGSAASISVFPSGSAASFSAFPSGSAASFSQVPTSIAYSAL